MCSKSWARVSNLFLYLPLVAICSGDKPGVFSTTARLWSYCPVVKYACILFEISDALQHWVPWGCYCPRCHCSGLHGGSNMFHRTYVTYLLTNLLMMRPLFYRKTSRGGFLSHYLGGWWLSKEAAWLFVWNLEPDCWFKSQLLLLLAL